MPIRVHHRRDVKGDGVAGQSGDRRPIAARETAPAQRVAAWLIRREASPDAISAAGMLAGVLAGLAFAATPWAGAGAAAALWLAGALLVQLRLLANLFDGMVAVGRGIASPLGELWNEVPDRVSDTAVLLGLSVAAGSWALGLAAALAAMSTAYVRTAARSAGAPSDFRGPMAKQQRMALVTALAVLCAILPPATLRPLLGFDPVALVLAVITLLSLATAARRLAGAATALRAQRGGGGKG